MSRIFALFSLVKLLTNKQAFFGKCHGHFLLAYEMNKMFFFSSGGSRGGARGGRAPLFWVKNEEMIEGRKASRAIISNLAQGLDLPLFSTKFSFSILICLCRLTMGVCLTRFSLAKF